MYDGRFRERVQLGDDARRLSVTRVPGLALDFRQQRLMQAEGRVQKLAQFRHLREPGELEKYFVNVLADGLIRGQQAVVGVEPGGLGVIVAGAQVAVPPQALLLAPNHHDQLGVRLEAEHAVHDVRTGFLQLGRELNVGFFIEARAQLDDDGHVLSGRRGLDQRRHDGGVVAYAIQGLLDGQYLRIAGCLLDEIRDRSKTLKRMMQKHIAGAEG